MISPPPLRDTLLSTGSSSPRWRLSITWQSTAGALWGWRRSSARSLWSSIWRRTRGGSTAPLTPRRPPRRRQSSPTFDAGSEPEHEHVQLGLNLLVDLDHLMEVTSEKTSY